MAGKRNLTARQLKFLFASRILRGRGSGKNRTVTYDKARAATVSRNRKRGVDVTSRKKASQVNKSGRYVFGGSKAARLRSGSAPARRVPSKAERDATRAARIAAGQSKATQFFAKAAVSEARTQARTGLGHSLRNHASGVNKTISVRGRIGAEAIVAPRGYVNKKAASENRATVFNRVRQEAARYYGLKGSSTSGRRDMGAALEAARKNSATRQAQRASFGRALRETRREKGGEAARRMLASYRNPDALKWRYLFRK
ncbi:hypothetical protein RDMS_01620 [Deinococcus sp. RL]|uniref:hypothetical protein n=1 Tax=Deinococcus sp. RL TaxID=1489678 RepID=UPI0004D8F6B4|nr:hypothetical protein [Deinococcus sp. RL]KEF35480.1 hypothetical protein RDMS_01620 [Deinococcus sp. RL]